MKSFNEVLKELSLTPKYAESTLNDYKKRYTTYNRWLDGRKPTPKNSLEFLSTRTSIKGGKMKPSAWNTYMASFRVYFKRCGVNKYAKMMKEGESYKLVSSSKLDNVRNDKFITPQELDKICSISENLRDNTVMRFAFSTGLRPTEILNTNVGDLMLNDSKVKVERLKKGRGKFARFIFPEIIIPLLRSYLESRGINYNNLSREDMGKPLFVSHQKIRGVRDKARMGYKAFYEVCRKYSGVIGKYDLSPHWFRHSFVVYCKKQNIPPEITAMQIGDTVETVVNIYSHYTTIDVDRVFDEIEGKYADSKDKNAYNPLEKMSKLEVENKDLLERIDRLERNEQNTKPVLDLLNNLVENGKLDLKKVLKEAV